MRDRRHVGCNPCNLKQHLASRARVRRKCAKGCTGCNPPPVYVLRHRGRVLALTGARAARLRPPASGRTSGAQAAGAVVSVEPLPWLLDCRALMTELGVRRATAEAIMRQIPSVHIDELRKTFARPDDVLSRSGITS